VIVLGLLLLILVAVVVIVAVLAGNEDADLNLLGATIDTSVRWVFLAGALSLLLLVIGLVFLGKGLRRERARRQEVKRLKAAAGPAAERPAASSHSAGRGVVSKRSTGSPHHPGPQAASQQDPDEQAHFESTPRE
jgi:uncharacterized integral membrane protein